MTFLLVEAVKRKDHLGLKYLLINIYIYGLKSMMEIAFPILQPLKTVFFIYG